jgi:hypothetical protein
MTGRGAPGVTHAEDRRDLAGHVVVGGDTGQRHEVHDPLLGLAAHHLGETGLAQPAGPDDRGDPGGAQQVGHRGEVVVAAEQRVGLVGHPVADDRRGALEQLLVDGLEGGAGVAAELVAERAAVGLVAVQRRRRSQRRRLAAQQLGQHLLVPGTLAVKPGQLVGRLGVATQPCQRQRPGTHQRPVGRRPLRAQRRHRVVQAGVGTLGRSVQRQARLGVRQRRRMVTGAGVPRGRRGAQQHRRGVDLVLAQGKAVAGRGGGDDVGAQLGPGAGDQNPERPGRVLGQLVRPEPLHQPGGAAAGAQIAGEQGQQAAQSGAGDLLVAVGHPRQQRQLDGHQSRVQRSRRCPRTRKPPVTDWTSLLGRRVRRACLGDLTPDRFTASRCRRLRACFASCFSFLDTCGARGTPPWAWRHPFVHVLGWRGLHSRLLQ